MRDEEKREKIKQLTPLQYKVTQKDGTEPPFENEYNNEKRKGLYVDRISGEALFLSSHKFDSGTGWPSFFQPIDESKLTLKRDFKHIWPRTEVRSKIADSHLGHVFNDGPEPTGKRYCLNSAALRFIAFEDLKAEGYEDVIPLF